MMRFVVRNQQGKVFRPKPLAGVTMQTVLEELLVVHSIEIDKTPSEDSGKGGESSIDEGTFEHFLQKAASDLINDKANPPPAATVCRFRPRLEA
jgi:hypothetical protein